MLAFLPEAFAIGRFEPGQYACALQRLRQFEYTKGRGRFVLGEEAGDIAVTRIDDGMQVVEHDRIGGQFCRMLMAMSAQFFSGGAGEVVGAECLYSIPDTDGDEVQFALPAMAVETFDRGCLG